MGIDHVQMALVDGDVDGLTEGAAGMVQGRRLIDQFHQVAEVFDGAVAPAAVEIADERWPVDRGEDRRIATDVDVALRIAGQLVEFGGRRLQEISGETAGHSHPLAVDVGTGIAPQRQRLLVVAKFDADLGKNGFGIRFDGLQAFIGQDLGEGDFSRDEGQGDGDGYLAAGTPGRAAASSASGFALAHPVVLFSAGPVWLAMSGSPCLARPVKPPPIGDGPGGVQSIGGEVALVGQKVSPEGGFGRRFRQYRLLEDRPRICYNARVAEMAP